MKYGELPELQLDGQTVRGVTVRNPNPPKTAVLRLPTAAEMIEWLDQQKTIRRSIGRGKFDTEFVPNYKSDLAFFGKIRLDKGSDEFNEYECSNLIAKLMRAERTACERIGDEYQITIDTPFGDLTHIMGSPTTESVFLYKRALIKSRDLGHGQEELRFPVAPAVNLYAACVKKFERYADDYKVADIPPHHKSVVIQELVAAVDDLGLDIVPNS